MTPYDRLSAAIEDLKRALEQAGHAVGLWFDEHGPMVGRVLEWVLLAAVATTVASTCLG